MKNFIRKYPVVTLMAILLFLSSCAPGNEKFADESAGFLMGLWHGFISLVTFIISLFNDDVTIYEIQNNGKLYNLGFIIGAAIFYGGGTKSSKWKKK